MTMLSDAVKPTAVNDHEGNVVPDAMPPMSLSEKLVHALQVSLDVNLRLGAAVDQLNKRLLVMERLQRFTPIDAALSASALVAANNTAFLNFGSPDHGTLWEIEMVAIGGTDANVALAGTAALYVVPILLNNVTGGMQNCADIYASLPVVRYYSGRRLVVNDSEYLVALVFGSTAAQQVSANCAATVINVAAAMGTDITIV